MKELSESSINLSFEMACKNWDDQLIEYLKKDALNKFIERSEEYGRYRIFTEKEESLKDSLFWEFGKKIVALSGKENNAGAIIGKQRVAVRVLKNLELKNFVEKVEELTAKSL